MTKPMTDERIRRWKETGEGFHTDEIADELLRLREAVKKNKQHALRLFRQMAAQEQELAKLRKVVDAATKKAGRCSNNHPCCKALRELDEEKP